MRPDNEPRAQVNGALDGASTDDADRARLELTLRATAPAIALDPAFRRMLRASLVARPWTTRYAALATPLGPIWVAYRENIVRYLSARSEEQFLERAGEALGEALVRDERPPANVARRVVAAIEGRRPLPSQVDLSTVTPFQRAVLRAALRIPRGEVRSYAWIARELGHPRAVRAVGTALARNPIPFVIPCHRVVRTNGDLGNYSGGGVETKARILQYEGVDLARLRDLAQRGLRFQGNSATKVFCLPTCNPSRPVSEKRTVYFHTSEEALRAGFTPCNHCRPVAPASA
ncbi:MAG: methylated-DNA--[protein]-cysteine S-methyltransferase [Ktedonobacterales bacterium]